MKFLASEYGPVKALIESSSLNYEDFAFVKKRGRLQMLYKKELQLAFHRKTETKLNEQQQWVKQSQYFVYLGKETLTYTRWDDVLRHFEEAIRALETGTRH